MKLSTQSDLFIWLVIIFPAFGIMTAIFQTQVIGIALLCGGFALMECGARISMRLSRAIARYAVAAVVAAALYYVVGYQVIFGETVWHKAAAIDVRRPLVLIESAYVGDYAAIEWSGVTVVAMLRAQGVFCVTCVLVFSAALGLAVRPMFQFVACGILAAIVYPMFGDWVWVSGLLGRFGFFDFSGGTVVYSIAGWSALPFLVAMRRSKVSDDFPREHLSKASRVWMYAFGAAFVSMALMYVGSFVTAEIPRLSGSYRTIGLAATGGAIAATVVSNLMRQERSLHCAAVGGFAGMAAIAARTLTREGTARESLESLLIGAVAGMLAIFSVCLLRRISLQDRLNIIPSFAVGGAWGTLYAGLFGERLQIPIYTATPAIQFVGVVSAFLWAGGVFAIVAGIANWRGWLGDKEELD